MGYRHILDALQRSAELVLVEVAVRGKEWVEVLVVGVDLI